MDEPSAQLQFDLKRAVQHELATCRPLLHRLHGISWLLQLPRPANAVRHGSRFYYNILVNPRLRPRTAHAASKSRFSRHSSLEDHSRTIAEPEELLRDLEILSSDLRPESNRKSNFTVEDEVSRLETLVDAVAITTTEEDDSYWDTYRQIHPDVPVFASPHNVEQISDLQHFRTLGTMATFGEDGCKDWRSMTAVAGMPEWVAMGLVPALEQKQNGHETVMVAFNNQYNGRDSTGSRQKRQSAAIRREENSDDDSAEAILFTTQDISDPMLISSADPPMYLLAVVGAQQTLQAAYRILERNDLVVDKGKGFLAWLIAKATFSSMRNDAPDDDKINLQESEEGVSLGNGESIMLL